MRHWFLEKVASPGRTLAVGIGVCISFWMASSSAGTSIASSMLRQSATFDNPFSELPEAITATTKHERQRVERENPYTRKKRAPFHPIELESTASDAPRLEIVEIRRIVVKRKTARLDPENPFERQRGTSAVAPQLENPFEGATPSFDYERPLRIPSRAPVPIKLDENAY